MFIGRYYYTVENKGRVTLPKPLRDQLENEDAELVLTRGLDGGLFLFPKPLFTNKLQQLAGRTFTHKRDRDFTRYLTNDAHPVQCDELGRVTLPDYLKEFAQIDKQVVIVGSLEYIEIWDVERYHQYLDYLEKNGEAIAESIDDSSSRTTD